MIQPTAVDVKAAPHLDRTLTALDTAPEAPPLDDRTRLERLWDSDAAPTAPDTAPFSDAFLEGYEGDNEPGCGDANDAIDGLPDAYLRALLWQCLAAGITHEAEQIKHLWGIVKSGENPRYERAKKRLRELRRKFNL